MSPDVSRPTSVPDVLPAFEATFEITVIAKDHDAAMAWAADWLERFCEDDATISGGLAHLPEEPVEFFDE